MSDFFTPDVVAAEAANAGYALNDAVELPPRPPRFAAIPTGLNERLKIVLQTAYPAGLYQHQVDAIAAALEGKDVCVSTSTASGKSLIFMTVALDLIHRNPSAKILALYPAKALIQDQIGKWLTALQPFRLAPSYIDGAVATKARPSILAAHNVVLMTPDEGAAARGSSRTGGDLPAGAG